MFGSGREEDRLTGYLSFLKIGPQLLKFIPGETKELDKDLPCRVEVWGMGHTRHKSSGAGGTMLLGRLKQLGASPLLYQSD